jgi:hypothetical protein
VKATQVVHRFLLVLLPLALLGLGLLVWARSSEAAADAQNGQPAMMAQNVNPSPPFATPPDLAAALNIEYGHFDRLVTPPAFLKDLLSAQIVCLGEAHYEARDMQTAFELARLLAQHRTVALAVERLSHNQQPQLDNLLQADSADSRIAQLMRILQADDYQKVWGARAKDHSGYPTNTPSQPVFESMLTCAAGAKIPMIGLDVSWAERSKGLGEDILFRTTLWENETESFLANHHAQNYLIVLVAGVSHCTNAPDTITYRLKFDAQLTGVVSVGQRDAMYQYLSSAKVAKLAEIYGLGDMIVQHPQVAIVSTKGVAEFPQPPDYWIAVHTPDSWN